MNQIIFKQAGFKGTACKCVATVIAAAAGIFIGQPAEAKITLPEIFSDNMVLQCSDEAAIWGWAAPERHCQSQGFVAERDGDRQGG